MRVFFHIVFLALLPLLNVAAVSLPVRDVDFRSAGCSRQPSSQQAISGAPYNLVAADATALCAVHDPTMAEEDGVLYVVSTDTGTPESPPLLRLRSSSDGGRTWATGGAVFPSMPSWVRATVPKAVNLWAPDLSFVGGRWLLYYAASSFGSQESAVGLASTLSLASANWTDEGAVLSSAPGDAYNAIDPTLLDDGNDSRWLVFGSFWDGIFVVPVDSASGKPLPAAKPVGLARRPPPDALEGAFLLARPDAFYLFLSWDYCCRGTASNYSVHVGRASSVAGPYVDREGVPLLAGGGSLVLGGGHGWAAGGGLGFLRGTAGVNDSTMVLHAYDGVSGAPYLQIVNVSWAADGWPQVTTAAAATAAVAKRSTGTSGGIVNATVSSELELLNALAAGATSIFVSDVVSLTAPLELHSRVFLQGIAPGAALTLPPGMGGPVATLRGPAAAGSEVASLRIAYDDCGGDCGWGRLPAALLVDGALGVRLRNLTIFGGVELRGADGGELANSDISNVGGAANGTCVYVPSAGNSSTLTLSSLVVHDNNIHDCRYDGKSPYDPSAQGVLLGAQDGVPVAPDGCCTGVVIRHNDLVGIDEMGIRVSTDAACANVLNQIVFNKVADWGQLNASAGGDRADSGCLYSYGHWMSPGNNFSFNACISRNASWGQNGLYFDDAATGNVAVGNVFINATAGSALKLNGGAYNDVSSILMVGGISAGFANCRGLRPPENYIYTCENVNTGQRWLRVLEANRYLEPPWSKAFPWYAGWCSVKTAGPHAYPCAPAGAPPAYECAVLPRGNAVASIAGVAMQRNGSFAIPTASGFPYLNPNSPCADFVVDEAFNAVDADGGKFYRDLDAVFVDAAAGDYTVRDDAQLYKDMPTFARIPWRQIGIGGGAV